MVRVRLLWDRDVAVFLADLDDQEPHDHLLSPDERERAARFRSQVTSRRYVAARAVLRSLLAEWEDVDPTELHIVCGSHGKPHLASHSRTSFNVSRSEHLALFALASPHTDVGVDIERIRSVDPVYLSASYFSVDERRELAKMAPSRRLSAFFDGWVRKEAIIKADGRGISLPLSSFSVSLDGPPLLTQPPPDSDDGPWWLSSIDVGDAARAAVALRETHRRSIRWR